MNQLLAAIMVLALPIEMAVAECGTASVYGAESGSVRADGKPFVPSHVGCAHKTRRLGSTVTVSWNGHSIRCPINDREPYVKGRILDLSRGAAHALGIGKRGLVTVCIR